MNLRSLNSSSMQGASFDREIASGFARKAISQDGEAVRSDSSAVAVDDAQVARTTSAPVVLRVGFKAGKMTAGKHGEDPEVSEAVRACRRAGWVTASKRAFDIVFSAFVLVSFSWLFVIVAIPSKSTIPRPPSFSSRSALVRMAKNSTCTSSAVCAWMPRTGSPSSGSLTRKAAQCSRSPRIRASLAWASGRVGKWLRKLSLDEFPQFINVLRSDIPLRILKTRPEFSEKSMGAFALPAKSSTNKEEVFSQVVSCFVSDLRMRRISGFNCKRVGSMEGQFLAKPVFRAVRA